MSVFLLCERAIGLVRGNRLILSGHERAMLESLNYEGLAAARAQDEAVTCVRHFAFVRDRLLRLHPWLFARRTAAPARLAAPIPGWAAAYALPADCLRLLALVSGKDQKTLVHYETLGRTVLCNHSPVHVRYTARVTDVDQWDPAFADAFCASLAGEAVAAITGEVNAIQMMEQRAQLAIQDAYRTGAISPVTGLPLQEDGWLDYSGIPSGFDIGRNVR